MPILERFYLRLDIWVPKAVQTFLLDSSVKICWKAKLPADENLFSLVAYYTTPFAAVSIIFLKPFLLLLCFLRCKF